MENGESIAVQKPGVNPPPLPPPKKKLHKGPVLYTTRRLTLLTPGRDQAWMS